ncbi:hypothetical protein [Arthrobacter sp. SD76]|uniref:hypothetical protein n=1 Tax=Arthrobacter sp. SD76 TaxID=3415007 RepID=UPI003C7379F7
MLKHSTVKRTKVVDGAGKPQGGIDDAVEDHVDNHEVADLAKNRCPTRGDGVRWASGFNMVR